jgi:poly-gamma-glutamate capsule biosynthesis protein CapA/YwtB (metallophosphatase superfamily)
MSSQRRQRRERRLIIFALGVVIIGGLFILGSRSAFLFNGLSQSEVSRETAVLYFTGDIMLDRGVAYAVNKYGGGDFRFPFLKIKDMFADADFITGNLEGTISNKGSDLGKLYSFHMNPKGIQGLHYAGFNALSQANNHIDDWGREAIADSKHRLEAAGITPLGVGVADEAYAPKTFVVKGIKIAIVALADFEVLAAEENKVGAAVALNDNVIKAVEAAKKAGDIAIVFYHFGEEYRVEPTPRQLELTELAFAHGADLVVGSHPHVVGPLEAKDGKYAAYSLGNFVFDQYFSKETMQGAVLRAEVDKDGVKNAKLIPIKINNRFQPEPAE